MGCSSLLLPFQRVWPSLAEAAPSIPPFGKWWQLDWPWRSLLGLCFLFSQALINRHTPARCSWKVRNGGKKDEWKRNLEGKDMRKEGGGYRYFALSMYLPYSSNGRHALGTWYSSRVHHITFAALNSPLLGFMSPAGSGLSDTHTPNSGLQVFMPGSLQRLVLTLTFLF